MTARERRWSIRFVDDLSDDLVDRVATFFEKYFPGVFGGPCDPEIFRWKLGATNPAGSGILAVAVTDDDEIAGVMTATMKQMTVEGRPVLGAETGDTFTHPDFRRAGRAAELSAGTTADHYLNRSVFGRLVDEVSRSLFDQNVELVYGTPNDQSLPGYCRRGGYEVAPTASAQSWHCPLTRLFIDRFPAATGRVTAQAFDRIRQTLHRPPDSPQEMTTIPLRRDTPTAVFNKVDRIWDNVPSGQHISIVQDGAWIRHRYALHPSQPYDLHLLGETDQPEAFAVSRTITRSRGATSRCIAEWSQSLVADPRRFGDLLARLIENTNDADTVSAWTEQRPAMWIRMLRAGFVPVKPVPVVLGCNKLGRRTIDQAIPFPLPIGWSDNV
jgi:hypothetical protein